MRTTKHHILIEKYESVITVCFSIWIVVFQIMCIYLFVWKICFSGFLVVWLSKHYLFEHSKTLFMPAWYFERNIFFSLLNINIYVIRMVWMQRDRHAVNAATIQLKQKKRQFKELKREKMNCGKKWLCFRSHVSKNADRRNFEKSNTKGANKATHTTTNISLINGYIKHF